MSKKLCVVVEMNGEYRTLYEGDTFTITFPFSLGMTIKSPPIRVEKIGGDDE